jgi:uncharacterized membrane protein YkoI
MTIKNIIPSMLALTLVAGGLTACMTEKEEGNEAKLQAQAKVSKAEAQATALAKVPGGTIKEGGLEKEKGKLIWSFDIATPGSADITEVAVDAITGAVLAVDKETPSQQAAEKKADAKEKK